MDVGAGIWWPLLFLCGPRPLDVEENFQIHHHGTWFCGSVIIWMSVTWISLKSRATFVIKTGTEIPGGRRGERAVTVRQAKDEIVTVIVSVHLYSTVWLLGGNPHVHCVWRRDRRRRRELEGVRGGRIKELKANRIQPPPKREREYVFCFNCILILIKLTSVPVMESVAEQPCPWMFSSLIS